MNRALFTSDLNLKNSLKMNCIIPGPNAKIFAKAIYSLGKIGTDLFLEFVPDEGLSVHSLNATKSAFATFKFNENFFSEFDTTAIQQNSDNAIGKCKVSLKACSNIFKNMRQVEFCKITIDSETEKLIVELKCNLDTLKKFVISILDVETLQAAYKVDNAPNKVTSSYKIFTEISNNFQMLEEEITLEAKNDSIIAKNYVEGSVVDQKFMRSQLTLKSDEFDKYLIPNQTSITFCLREFRSFLHFAESANLDVTLHFEEAGRPCVFTITNLDFLEGNLVMSTLSPDDVTFLDMTNGNETSKVEKQVQNRMSTTKRKMSEDDNSNKKKTKTKNLNSLANSLISIDLTKESDDINDDCLQNNDKTTQLDNDELETDQAEDDCVPNSPNAYKGLRFRTIFARCFEPTYFPSQNSSDVLAPCSDTEDY